jgi:hypothetical protein
MHRSAHVALTHPRRQAQGRFQATMSRGRMIGRRSAAEWWRLRSKAIPFMQRAFVVVLVGAGVFVWFTSADLPPIVASHFDAHGVANGFMSRGAYTVLVLSLVVGVPALIGFSAPWLRRLPPQLINVLKRQYWLAPQRRAASLESLSSMFLALAFGLVFFLCFVHWLVVLYRRFGRVPVARTSR